MGTVYLIPSLLAPGGMNAIPAQVTDTIKKCRVFFTENERTTRRYFKQLWKERLPGADIIIDDYEWHTMTEADLPVFRQKLKEGTTIGIISEAGCPGVADPGQAFVSLAHELDIPVIPLAGPNAILLALMASGMNGQRFRFSGYLPVENQQRVSAIKELEAESLKKDCTQVFIETPYRNNQLTEALLDTCRDSTRLCIAVDITGENEWIKTRTIHQWKKNKPDIHKRPAIFLLYAGA